MDFTQIVRNINFECLNYITLKMESVFICNILMMIIYIIINYRYLLNVCANSLKAMRNS